MRHGIDGYFQELETFHRRVSAIGVGVAVFFLVALFVARQPAVETVLDDPKRFGFEGPDQYVERILLEMRGPEEQLGSNTMSAVPVSLREGGGSKKASESGTKPVPEGETHGEGPGSDEMTIEARLRALALEGPVVQSEDLVVEELVRPEYPEEARDKDIEGLVELVALVDTTGSVIQVEIIGGTRNPLLDQAATTAVLKCRYRPYRVHDVVERVWAYFRISFKLY
jgi:TonB family protein